MPGASVTRSSIIRLVGGPRWLDGSTYDLSLSAHDRADAADERFVRAVRGTTATSLSALGTRCHDRAAAEGLAGSWQVAVYVAGRHRRHRARLYRHRATVGLRAERDGLGRWRLVPDDAVAPAGGTTGPATEVAPGPLDETPALWSELEEAVDRAAARFVAVAALLPDGPLAERAGHCRAAVAACVADAARLCAVGAAVSPDPRDALGAPVAPGAERVRSLAGQVVGLVDVIDAATAHLVDVHLEVGAAPPAIDEVAHLAVALSETVP